MFRTPFFVWISKLLGIELPRLETMDEYIDFILPRIRYLGEDLFEEDFFLNTRWLEVSDLDENTYAILHIFMANYDPKEKDINEDGGGSYLKSVDGDISEGMWNTILKSNTFIVKIEGRYELYDLAFLNKHFFILKKHRNQHTPIPPYATKYFILVKESQAKRGDEAIPWRDIMEMLYNVYRLNFFYIFTAFIFIAFIIFIVLLSLQ